MEQLSSHWTEFHEILYLNILRKHFGKIKVSLKPDQNYVYIKWGSIDVYDNMTRNSSQNGRCLDEVVEKLKTHIALYVQKLQ